MSEFAKTLIFFGVVLIVAGFLVGLFGKVPGIGRLPGDVYFRKGAFTFYFPLTTCVIFSAVVTLILWLFNRR